MIASASPGDRDSLSSHPLRSNDERDRSMALSRAARCCSGEVRPVLLEVVRFSQQFG